jgi:hypothetical protein
MPQRRKRIGCYEKHIIEVVQCSETEATVVEEIMRSEIFHSTLDWQTVEEFRNGAREAYAALSEMRTAGTLPSSYQRTLQSSSRRASRRI